MGLVFKVFDDLMHNCLLIIEKFDDNGQFLRYIIELQFKHKGL